MQRNENYEFQIDNFIHQQKKEFPMQLTGSLAKARKYVESHTKLMEDTSSRKKIKPGPCLTISRQCGIDTVKIGNALVQKFNKLKIDDLGDWAVFDKNLIDKVLNDHDLPERLNKFMTEEKMSTMNSMLNELLKVHPPILKLLHKTSSTIFKLAEMGNVIIVGRGGNLVTAGLKNTFHIRLVAPLNRRIEEVQRIFDISKKDAEKMIAHEDKARAEYFQNHFHKDIDDPLLYHAVINIGLYDFDMLINTISEMVTIRFPKFFKV